MTDANGAAAERPDRRARAQRSGNRAPRGHGQGNRPRPDHAHWHAHRGHAHADHGHGHAHGDHAHDAEHLRSAGRRILVLVLGLTATFMVAEVVGGLLSNSLALLADAAHMLTDVAAIALALFALWFAQRPATPEKTYGYLRLEILAALVNGAALIVIALGIFYGAYQRFANPEPVESRLMLAVAAVGLLVNVVAAVLLHRSAGHNLNLRGAYLHVLGDLLGSVGAIVAALVILTTGWVRRRPADLHRDRPADPGQQLEAGARVRGRAARGGAPAHRPGRGAPRHRGDPGRGGGARPPRLDRDQRLPRHERPRRGAGTRRSTSAFSTRSTTACTTASASAT